MRPVFPQQQTLLSALGASVQCQKQTSVRMVQAGVPANLQII
jgi:hypothetical protein